MRLFGPPAVNSQFLPDGNLLVTYFIRSRREEMAVNIARYYARRDYLGAVTQGALIGRRWGAKIRVDDFRELPGDSDIFGFRLFLVKLEIQRLPMSEFEGEDFYDCSNCGAASWSVD